MTYGELLLLTKVYLGGDYALPKDDDSKLVALKSAYYFAADHCTALKLLTASKDNSIIRMGPGHTYVRMPALPSDTTDKLDIDSELCPAIARTIAHYVAKDVNMKEYHKREALDLFRRYEAKVVEYMEDKNSEGKYNAV